MGINPVLTSRRPVFDRFGQVVFFAYLLLTLLLVFFHEPWEDELQAWCIAQELNAGEILHQMRYEGHFALWYLLLKLLVLPGGSLSLLNLVSWGLCVAAAGMLLAGHVFSRGVKLLILISCPMLYWFPVVARNYALIPLALALLAGLYPVRLKKPFAYAFSLLLLVHSHAYMEGLAGMLGVFFAWDLIRHTRRMEIREKLKSAAVLLLIGAGVLTAFLQVAPAFGVSSFAPASAGEVFGKIGHLPEGMLHALKYLALDFAHWFSRLTSHRLGIGLFYAALSAGVVQLFRTRPQAGFIFLGGFIWQILFAVLIYRMALHRVYLPFLMLIFCFSLPVRRKQRHVLKKFRFGLISLGILAALTLPDTLHYISMDAALPFSNQSQMAFFIEKNLPEKAKIVVFPDTLITGTFRAYLPNRVFCRSSDGRPFRLFRTSAPLPERLDDALLLRFLESGDEPVYLLFQTGAFLSYQLPKGELCYDFPSCRMEFLFATTPNAFFSAGEDYVLFKVTRKAAGP